jgi:anti-sigma regulatory factor (Ser/Thr protein kinase)
VPTHLEREFAATPAEATSARAAITALCRRLQLGVELTQRVSLAVHEACINCLEHAYTDRPDSTYMLETRVTDGALLVVVHDYGSGLPHAGEDAGTGFGLRMIEQLADGTNISSQPGHGTRVAMRFGIRPPPA